MKKSLFGRIFFFITLSGLQSIFGQSVSGIVKDVVHSQPVPAVTVSIPGTAFSEQTDSEGRFSFSEIELEGEYILIFSKMGYFIKNYPVTFSGEIKDLGLVLLQPDIAELQGIGSIHLEAHELDDDFSDFSNVSGLLQATRDVFLNAAAFDFSSTFFRPRGIDSEFGIVAINGIVMNKFSNARPVWSNWGGLNDVQRNQVFSVGMKPSDVSFGGPAGTTNIIMRASQYQSGGKVSYALANRSYTGRVLGSYSSGLLENNWAYSFSFGRRFAEESFVDGSLYDANSFFASVEKKINETHSLNFTGFYTPLRRGKNSPNTEEVYELRGNRYNSYWGYQDGEIRNSRIKRVEEPVVMLNHFWDLNSKIELNTNVAYQFGESGNSRIDYGGSRMLQTGAGDMAFIGGGSNPDPAYYQKMPSYFFRSASAPNFTEAYLAQEDFLKNGQLDWERLYRANQTSTTGGGNSLYVLYEDRNDEKRLWTNSYLRAEINRSLKFNAGVGYTAMKSENFGSLLDLLGGESFFDIDGFSAGNATQNDLQNPNRQVLEGERIKYDYDLLASSYNAFIQAQWFLKYFEAYAAADFSNNQYQRIGNFQNGNFPDHSLGAGENMFFNNYGIKSGMTYKFSGRNLLDLNLAHFHRAPALNDSYSNVRQNNFVVEDLQNEKVANFDVSYIHRSTFVKTKITGFHSSFKDGTEISFYYADGLSGLGEETTTAFVQEVLTGIGRSHSGVELGVEAQVTSTLKFKAAGSAGKYIYDRNPDLYLASDDFKGNIKMGTAAVKGYRIPGGPQQAGQVGFEYRDPAYWWLSGTANFFSKAYVDVAPLARTKNFYTDIDGLPQVNYDPEVAVALLKQEELGDYMLVNLVGGKSWKIKNRFVGFFSSINNILNEEYKTGGYEQSRNVSYNLLKEDKARERPLFAPKYWFGPGTTYYAHVYLRF